MTRKVLKLTAGSSEIEELDLDASEGSLAVLQRAVDGLIQPVQLKHGDLEFEMYVNEEFLYSSETLNDAASILWVRTNDDHMFVLGNAVVTGGLDFESGETLGVTPEIEDYVRQIAGLPEFLKFGELWG